MMNESECSNSPKILCLPEQRQPNGLAEPANIETAENRNTDIYFICRH
ncbi:hypothetical protein P3T23_009405 [Paraburkholderia sp. GAS448]